MAVEGSPESDGREGALVGAAPEAPAGRILGGRYRLLRRLGSGGMGTVYLCEHVVLGRQYALKVLHADTQGSPDVVERFKQEARAASRITQENVVDVVDFGEDPGGELFYVMEVLGGQTLAELMGREGPLPLPRALSLLEQVCRALAAAHASDVVHRDVKPDNVLVERLPDGTERAKLIDFGISHVPGTGRLTMDGEIIGTPEYMAPEQASGGEIDALTDVYAAGVLGYELVTGTLPLLGATAIATLVAHKLEAPVAPSARRPGVPPEVDRLLLRALAKRPSDRFPSMQALVAEVMRVRVLTSLADAGVGAPEGSPAGGRTPDHHGTGRGGTISLAAVDAAPAAPVLPPYDAFPPAATVPQPGGTAGRRRLAAAAGIVAVAAVVAAVVLLATLRGGSPARPAVASVAPPAPAPTSPAAPAGQAGQAPAPAAPAPAPEPPVVAAPRPVEADPGATPRAARPARQETPGDVKDPYATPADPLKPDPFR